MRVYNAVIRWLGDHSAFDFVVATTRDRMEEEVVKSIVPSLKWLTDDEDQIRDCRDFGDLIEWGYDNEQFEVITNSQVEIKSDKHILKHVMESLL